MDFKWRVGLTVMFWVVGIGVTFIFLNYVALGVISDWLLIVPLIVMLIATISLWASEWENPPAQQRVSDKQTDNTPYTMALLMEMMDDDEREAFKYELKRRVLSGETLTNESLIEELDKRKRG